jgi:6-pyruvoyltetrahydropterin/6-carboxytetrahydropterin synthase
MPRAVVSGALPVLPGLRLRAGTLEGNARCAAEEAGGDKVRYFEITREIGIDAAHRVPHHASKCHNVHGHRYVVEATICGRLIEEGEQTGMVMDFGFLKDEMMAIIDAPADHAMIMWENDPLAPQLREVCGKLLEVAFVPTAENLAAYWFQLLQPRVIERTGGVGRLSRIRVHETPNCYADYSEGARE